jgi:hypothetical protein
MMDSSLLLSCERDNGNMCKQCAVVINKYLLVFSCFTLILFLLCCPSLSYFVVSLIITHDFQYIISLEYSIYRMLISYLMTTHHINRI